MVMDSCLVVILHHVDSKGIIRSIEWDVVSEGTGYIKEGAPPGLFGWSDLHREKAGDAV